MGTTKVDSLSIALHSAYCSLLEGHKAVYAVVPITSGKRLWNVADGLGISELTRVSQIAPERYVREVLNPNCNDAMHFAAEIRRMHPRVIDPSRVLVGGWTQLDYKMFWERIISEYVNALVLSPGWEFSTGCVYECLFAVQHRIIVIDLNQKQVPLPALRAAVLSAIKTRDRLQLRADFLTDFMDATEMLSQSS